MFTVIIYISLLLFTIGFHTCLIFGASWGEYTMGGQTKGVLPNKLRIGSFISIIVLSYFIYFTLAYLKFLPENLAYFEGLKFLILGFNVLAVILNTITRSHKERNLWAPITIVMLISSWIIFF